jgi:glucuronoarabinoxylan endo-1,4-beta-xylanase
MKHDVRPFPQNLRQTVTKRWLLGINVALLSTAAIHCGSDNSPWVPPSDTADGSAPPDASVSSDASASPDTSASPDAHHSEDSGTSPDSGEPPDAGTSSDSGATPDSGEPPDGGTPPDSGVALDSGEPHDASVTPDSSAPHDASVTPDSGAPHDASVPEDSSAPRDASEPPKDAGVDAPRDATADAPQHEDSGPGHDAALDAPPPPHDSGPPPATQVVVNFGSPMQVMDGFGASESWVPTITDAQADLFFSTTNGIGLSMLRLGISPSGGLFSGSWGTAQKALARNSSLYVWGTPWSPPAADKTTNNTTTGSILPTAYGSWASVLAAFVTSARANGVPLAAISAQNEPDYNTNGLYEMCLYNGTQMTALVKALGPALAPFNPPVRLIMPEPAVWNDLWAGQDYVGAVMADSTAAGYVGILATHQYGGTTPNALPAGKHLWETEMSDFNPFDPGIGQALGVANWIHTAVVNANVSAWHYWWLVCQGTDNEGLIGKNSDGTLTKRVFAMGNFSRFVRPGWTRLGTTGTVNQLLVSAYANLSTDDFAIVAVNTAGGSQTVTFGVTGPAVTSVTPYVTSGTPVGNIGTDGNLSQGSAAGNVPTTISVSMNAFTATIPQGIVTFVGKGH